LKKNENNEEFQGPVATLQILQTLSHFKITVSATTEIKQADY